MEGPEGQGEEHVAEGHGEAGVDGDGGSRFETKYISVAFIPGRKINLSTQWKTNDVNTKSLIVFIGSSKYPFI